MRLASWSRNRSSDRMELVDVVAEPGPDLIDALFLLVAEAAVLQDQAEDVLAAAGRGEHLGLVAPRGGPLVRRFFALRDALPRSEALRPSAASARTAQLVRQLDTIFLHHAMQISTALEFLAVAGRSDQMSRHLASFAGLGRPAALLDEIYTELRAARS